MRSPFPGMDPYLERHWRDVHGTLIVHARAQLNAQLGGGLRARIEERRVIEHPWEESRSIYPAVRVIETATRDRPLLTSGVAVAEPLIVPARDELAKERYIEIFDAGGGRVITVIEFVSPTNKIPGDGREQYLRKQQEVRGAGINLVEIDLTRRGHRQLAFPEAELPPNYRGTYLACVYRGFAARRFEIYPLSLRERLPGIRIPLRDEDPDASLDLQSLVDRAYEEGRYDDLDYSVPCEPPLSDDDARWAAELLTRL